DDCCIATFEFHFVFRTLNATHWLLAYLNVSVFQNNFTIYAINGILEKQKPMKTTFSAKNQQ
ncbi:MAG: hypothetical protein QXP44_00540, partial [Candidatus Bathyarchaeia archaeon]